MAQSGYPTPHGAKRRQRTGSGIPSAPCRILTAELTRMDALDDVSRAVPAMGAILGRLKRAQIFRRAIALVFATVVVTGPVGHAASRKAGKAAKASRVEHSVIGCTNQQRARYGLPGLHPNRVLRHAAEYHARNMLQY